MLFCEKNHDKEVYFILWLDFSKKTCQHCTSREILYIFSKNLIFLDMKEKIMRILSKNLMIALIAISMATFPALRANAQAAGSVSGVTATTALIIGILVVGAVVSKENTNGRPVPVVESPAPTAPVSTASTGGSSSTTTN